MATSHKSILTVLFHMVLEDRGPCRKAIEEVDTRAGAKHLKREEGVALLAVRLQQQVLVQESLKHSLDTWTSVLSAVLTPEHHGSQKPENETWLAFFANAISKEIQDAPMGFQDGRLSFENAIVLLSTHISLLRKDLEKGEKAVESTKKMHERSTQVLERGKIRSKRRLDKIFQIKADGLEGVVADDKRTGCAVLFH